MKNQDNKPAAGAKKPAAKTKTNPAYEVAKQHGVKKVFENTKGEYFLREDYALLSESGNPKLLKTHDFSAENIAGDKAEVAEEIAEPAADEQVQTGDTADTETGKQA